MFVLNIDLSVNFHPDEDSNNFLLNYIVILRSCGSYIKIIMYK